MQAATERKTAAKAVAKTAAKSMSQADKEFEAMKAYMKKVTSSKKAATTFLEDAGIIDRNGRLAKQYRS